MRKNTFESPIFLPILLISHTVIVTVDNILAQRYVKYTLLLFHSRSVSYTNHIIVQSSNSVLMRVLTGFKLPAVLYESENTTIKY